MTIYEFLEKRKKYPEPILSEVLQMNFVWSYNAVRGYYLAALHSSGLSNEQVSLLSSALDAALDNMSIEEAAAYFMECV